MTDQPQAAHGHRSAALGTYLRNLRRGLKERWRRARARWLHRLLPEMRLPTAWRYQLILDQAGTRPGVL